MIFYNNFIIFNIVVTVLSKNIGIKYGVETPIPRSVGLKFYTEISNTNRDDYLVDVSSDVCCLDDFDPKCNIVKIMGRVSDVVKGGSTKNLTMVAPLLDPYDRKGYCTLYVDTRPISKPKDIERETVKIKFNTKIKKGNVPDNVKICKHVDQDPLNECKPVNCDTYYNGRKSYYSVIKKRCVAVPTCASPRNAAYNPISNKCIYKPAISKEDIDYVKELSQSNKDRSAKNVLIIKGGKRSETDSFTSDDVKQEPLAEVTTVASSNIDDDEKEIDKDEYTNILKSKQSAKETVGKVKYKTNKTKLKSKDMGKGSKLIGKLQIKDNRLNYLLKCVGSNKYTLVILSAVIFIQCCLICTLVYCVTKSCGCFKKKQIVKKFFNYRQDASVTTPLIGTSNVDTETTDYQYSSESSNYIDKKIKCYKACQKERGNNMKLSMSDDILSKCITRRDWHRLPRSDTIPEVNKDEEIQRIETKDLHGTQKKATEMKVNFEEEYTKKNSEAVKSIVKNIKSNADVLSNSSEREIHSHNYNNENGSNMTGFKRDSHYNDFNIHTDEKNKSNSVEKGAQIYFSNDSIDDFLSEHGSVFIGDDPSKYSFTNISSVAKSSRSSKTSKINIVKNFLTLVSRKSKGPSSDPGVKKSTPELDLELLHLSRASIYSSSNGTEDKELKRIKDSTSSL